jgi:hypothetical protein
MELVQKLTGLLIANIIRVNMYKQGARSISSSLNKPLQEHLDPTPIIILITLFWNKNTLLALLEFPQKTVPYFISEWKYA